MKNWGSIFLILFFYGFISASDITILKDIPFKKYEVISGLTNELKFDLYQPEVTYSTPSPIAIFLHGGGFHAGEKEDPKIVELCNRMAKSGFYAAAVEYRTGIEKYNESQFVNVLLKAMLDAGDFMTFIRDNSSKYKIDTNNIFIGGISAGAIVSLHLAYWDNDEIINYLEEHKIKLHLPDRIKTFSKPKGVLNCWGILLDPQIMENNNIPIVSFHGKKDRIAPYKKGHPMHIPWLPKVYGSSLIHEEAKRNNITSLFHTYAHLKHGHEENTPYMDTTFNMMNSFMSYVVSGQVQNISLLYNPQLNTKVNIETYKIPDSELARQSNLPIK